MQTDLNHRGHMSGFAAAAFALLAVLLAVWASPMAAAVEVTSLYTVEVPLDPDDPDAQSSAYRRALTAVLVRVTGTGAAAESEALALLFPNPARFVRQYRPGPDNSLIVSLDGPAIEGILRQSGATVWGAERPLTVIWLAIDWEPMEISLVPIGADPGAQTRAEGEAAKGPFDCIVISQARSV